MTNVQDLVDMANKLSMTLEKAANDEKKFCSDIQLVLERMSWEIYRHANDLKEIQVYCQ